VENTIEITAYHLLGNLPLNITCPKRVMHMDSSHPNCRKTVHSKSKKKILNKFIIAAVYLWQRILWKSLFFICLIMFFEMMVDLNWPNQNCGKTLYSRFLIDF